MHKSTYYFATFEKKREVSFRSPLPTQSKFLVFDKFHLFDYMTMSHNYHVAC